MFVVALMFLRAMAAGVSKKQNICAFQTCTHITVVLPHTILSTESIGGLILGVLFLCWPYRVSARNRPDDYHGHLLRHSRCVWFFIPPWNAMPSTSAGSWLMKSLRYNTKQPRKTGKISLVQNWLKVTTETLLWPKQQLHEILNIYSYFTFCSPIVVPCWPVTFTRTQKAKMSPDQEHIRRRVWHGRRPGPQSHLCVQKCTT